MTKYILASLPLLPHATAATIIFSLITYKTLATQEIEWIAGICNHLGCWLVYAASNVDELKS